MFLQSPEGGFFSDGSEVGPRLVGSRASGLGIRALICASLSVC